MVTAASLALVHTVIGVDHTLPFIALARARDWSLTTLLVVTGLCGVGHVLSSVALGSLGLGLGATVARLGLFDSFRGNLAGWLLIAFGTVFAVRGLLRASRGAHHHHVHQHADGTVHEHGHDHHQVEHRHPHPVQERSALVWTLFVIFVLGPCEPLIPLLMAPALGGHWSWVPLIVTVFGVVTIGTMLLAVTVGYYGLRAGRWPRLEAHSDVLTGCVIAGSGAGVQLLGI